MADQSLQEKAFVWQLGKAIVADISPTALKIYDDVSVDFIENNYKDNIRNTAHLSSDIIPYVLMALYFTWDILQKYLKKNTDTYIQPFEEHQIVSKMHIAITKYLTLTEQKEIIKEVKVRISSETNILEEDRDDIMLRVIQSLFNGNPIPEYGKYPGAATNKNTNMFTILLLTPLPLELEAVLHHLTQRQEPEVKDQIAYEKGIFQGKHHQYQVIVAEPGMKNIDMALVTERAIARFKPQIALLIGIAGGVKDVAIGDVVVAKKAYGYEAGKEGEGQFWARPSVEAFSGELLARAQLLSRRNDWKQRAPDKAETAKVFMGPIAAGDKVVTSSSSETYKRLKDHYNDTLALEMEAIGFAMSIQRYRDLHGLAIRGISDLLDHKSDGFQVLAAQRAAAFAFELLYQLDGGDFLKSSTGNKSTGDNIKVDNARNVIVGSNISVGGNLHIGDVVQSQKGSGFSSATTIEQFIQRGQLEKALEILQIALRQSAPTYHQEGIALSERFEQLSKKRRMGLISNSEQTQERNQIVAAVLELAGKLKGV
jgi:nucleoside phosphorylase